VGSETGPQLDDRITGELIYASCRYFSLCYCA